MLESHGYACVAIENAKLFGTGKSIGDMFDDALDEMFNC